MTSEPKYVFFVESMVASRSGEPAVIVTVNGADFTTNMSVAEARDMAFNLLGAAEAAEGDAFLVDFLKNQVGAEEQYAVAILMDFREWREKRNGS